MKLVVRKLEQLFTGGEAVVGDLCVMQQQDISNLAAAEEHEAKVLAGEQIDCEGAREASLMSPPHNINNNNGNRYSTDSESRESPSGGEEPEEQRPTRPIDLDPQREQVAEINIEYLTHMTESSTKGLAEGSGWVYLNLIINLAQLHTINVTPPFIKKAIAAASNRLELSSDGNMVRWRVGGLDAPNSWNSGSVSGTGGSGSCEQSPQTSSGRKTVDQFESVNGSGSMPANHGTTKAHGGAEHGFHYKPIFARSQSFEDDSSSCDTTTDTDPDRAKRSSSGESRGTNIKDQGPIIFYKGGGFCTDLSSQPLREEDEAMGNYSQPIRYVRASSRPLGSTSHNPPPPSTKYESPLFRQGTAFSDADVMQIDRDDPGVLDFSPQFTAISPDSHAPPFEFEASGIGGVQPADNFAINCQTRHYLLSDNHGRLPVSRSRALKPSLQKKLLHRIPKAAIEVFYDQDENMTGLSAASSESTGFKKQRGRRLLHHEVLSAKTLKLPPSSLPPASYIFASLSEDSSSYCETDDDAPRSSGSEDYFFHQTAISSSEDSDIMAANFTRRSPSSVATAGDGSRASSVFMGEDGDENEDEEDEDEEEEEEETEDSGEGADLFEDPLSMDESSSTGSSSRVLPPPPLAAIRPSLKRSRGSVISASSIPARKNARVGAGSGSDES